MVLFILISDIDKSWKSWYEWIPYNTNDKLTSNFVSRLENLGKVFIPKPNFVNFRKYAKYDNNTGYGKDIYFKIEDLEFENYADWIYNQIENKDDKFVVIGFEQGCHHAKFFANRYHKQTIACFILGDRILTKENYEKIQNETYYNSLKEYFGEDWKKYTIDNMTNKKLKQLLDKIEEDDNIPMYLNGFVKLKTRSQLFNIKKALVPTYIYTYTQIQTEETERLHKKYAELSEPIKVKYYYLEDDAPYFIYGKHKDKIIEDIKGVLSMNGGKSQLRYEVSNVQPSFSSGSYYKKYFKYKQKYLALKNNQKHSVHMKGGGLIFHVSGPQGSGKTTLGNKLLELFDDSIYVKDLDDLFNEFTNSDDNDYQIFIDNFVETHQDKPLIFVGLDADRCLGPAEPYRSKQSDKYYNLYAKYKFYIDLPQEQILKQRFLRQVNKMYKRKEWFFDTWLEKPEMINAKLKRFTDLEGWKLEMESCADLYTERDYKFMHPDNILKKIKQYLEE